MFRHSHRRVAKGAYLIRLFRGHKGFLFFLLNFIFIGLLEGQIPSLNLNLSKKSLANPVDQFFCDYLVLAWCLGECEATIYTKNSLFEKFLTQKLKYLL